MAPADAARHHLLRAAVLEGPPALAAWDRWRELVGDQADADAVRLFPLLYAKVAALRPEDPALPRLKAAYRHAWAANHRRLAAAADALRALADAGIATAILKGAALVVSTYPSAGLRPMEDVDVLVAAEHALAAGEALLRAGWRPALAAGLDRLVVPSHGTLLVDGAAGRVDLHWATLWWPVRDDGVLASARPVSLGGAPTRCPRAEDLLLHACVHGMWSDAERSRWVVDAMAVLRANPALDWRLVVARARAWDVTVPLREALSQLAPFGPSVPADVLPALAATHPAPLERAAARAWRARPTRRRAVRLALVRGLRQRRHAAPELRAGMVRFLGDWTRVALDLAPGERLVGGLARRIRRRWPSRQRRGVPTIQRRDGVEHLDDR